jgi:hypothetical protein
MSRPEFRRRQLQRWVDLGCDPAEIDATEIGSPWRAERFRERAERLHAEYPSGFGVDEFIMRMRGRLKHEEYVRRTGGVRLLDMEWYEVPLHHFCCDQWEMVPEVHRDRHGNLRPETVMAIGLMQAVHWYACPRHEEEGDGE